MSLPRQSDAAGPSAADLRRLVGLVEDAFDEAARLLGQDSATCAALSRAMRAATDAAAEAARDRVACAAQRFVERNGPA